MALSTAKLRCKRWTVSDVRLLSSSTHTDSAYELHVPQLSLALQSVRSLVNPIICELVNIGLASCLPFLSCSVHYLKHLLFKAPPNASVDFLYLVCRPSLPSHRKSQSHAALVERSRQHGVVPTMSPVSVPSVGVTALLSDDSVLRIIVADRAPSTDPGSHLLREKIETPATLLVGLTSRPLQVVEEISAAKKTFAVRIDTILGRPLRRGGKEAIRV